MPAEGVKNPGIARRAARSLAGLRLAWRRERSFRTNIQLSALAVVAVGLTGPGALGWAVLGAALGASLGMEAMNAAVETLLDRLHPEQHPEIGAAKDIASAAAFVANVAFAVVCLAVALS